VATYAPSLQPVGGADEFSGAGPFSVSAGSVDLVLLRAAGRLRAFEGLCPHQGALLGEGEIDGDHLVCRNHQWRFNIETGARAGGVQILRECTVVERDGQVLADVTPIARAQVAQKPPTRAVQGLPGPRGLPLLGNVLQLRSRELHLAFEAWAAQYGPVYLVHLGRRPVVVVSDPRLSVQILRARPETFRRASSVATAFDSIGISGVFSAEGSECRPQRRLAMEALSQRNLRSFSHAAYRGPTPPASATGRRGAGAGHACAGHVEPAPPAESGGRFGQRGPARARGTEDDEEAAGTGRGPLEQVPDLRELPTAPDHHHAAKATAAGAGRRRQRWPAGDRDAENREPARWAPA
jgi:nitrite reductase/ring-hydroxylating ferredoxin subunit